MGKLKSFEEYIANVDAAEEIENTEVEMGEPTKAEGGEEVVTGEQGEDEVEVKDEVEGEEAAEEVVESSDDESEEKDSPEHEAGETEEEESKEDKSKETKEDKKAVTDMLKEVYNNVKEEAKVWEEDMHDEHTIESYLKENAALIATFAANTLKEMKSDITLEMYEGTCNELKDAYSKKMDEMKEAWTADGEEIEDTESSEE
jgi:hypothetical protein